jgi:Domain of unknown function (DUF4160)
VFSWRGYRFHFFSNEGSPLEPCHIHVQKNENRAKYWLEPLVSLEHNSGFTSKELKEFRAIILENEDLIKDKWNEYFNN